MSMKKDSLTREFNYYKLHQSELVAEYNGRYIVIVGDKVVGDYGTQEDAVVESMKKYKLGEFLVQLAGSGEDNYTQTFHSRVSYATKI